MTLDDSLTLRYRFQCHPLGEDSHFAALTAVPHGEPLRCGKQSVGRLRRLEGTANPKGGTPVVGGTPSRRVGSGVETPKTRLPHRQKLTTVKSVYAFLSRINLQSLQGNVSCDVIQTIMI
ncbi:hypothetical protein [Dendronalium sp. ChiSLP03b]|uniref:hypothetical protein n=1 Tax=Dendronalium sp. ChiSLP03b TaxID=3075381 RepID=UPI002AD65455|nr:hypothetical protein [Dendronalium sp. ChiSLP03b]